MNKIAYYLFQKRFDNKVAVRYRGEDKTFEEIHKMAEKLSLILTNIDSQITAIYLPNSIYYIVAYFACTYSDKVIFPEMIMYDLQTVKDDLMACGISTVIIPLELIENFEQMFNHVEVINFMEKIAIVVIEDIEQKEKSLDESVCEIIKTSGTTSYKSKYVMLTDTNLDSVVKIFCKQNGVNQNTNSFDNVLFVLPLPSSYCNAQLLIHFYLGDTILLYDGAFSTNKFWKMIDKYSVPRIETISTMLVLLLRDDSYKKYNIKSLKYIGVGGMELPSKYFEMFIQQFPDIIILQEYGMTEAAPLISIMDEQNWLKKRGSVGKPDESIEVIVDHTNEILVKGDNVMLGYYLDKDATFCTLKNGWLHTGDLGIFDEDGYLYLIGRKKNIIISAGYNISPEEIERVIMELPQVANVIVSGYDHPILGQGILAQIVLMSECTSTEIRKYCKQKLDLYKVPQRIEFIDQIPTTLGGKIKRSCS